MNKYFRLPKLSCPLLDNLTKYIILFFSYINEIVFRKLSFLLNKYKNIFLGKRKALLIIAENSFHSISFIYSLVIYNL